MKHQAYFLFVLTLLLLPAAAAAQSVEKRGTDNISVEGHIPLGGVLSVMDLELEQDMDRPYAYVARGHLGEYVAKGMDIIDLSDPASPRVLMEWRIENEYLHTGLGGMDVKYFKWQGRTYVVQSFQFGPGPNYDLGAVVFDVTGLPDAESVVEVARITESRWPGGFHNIFLYQHSDGNVYLFTTVNAGQASVYDMGKVVSGDVENALVAAVPVPPEAVGGPAGAEEILPSPLFYHDLYVAWNPDKEADLFYGGGTGGYYVWNVTDVAKPTMEFEMTGIQGVQWGHTFTPSPDGRYAVTETEYQYAPLRMFDLKPGMDGEVENIRRPISAWTANWEHLVHNHEVRWPYVFVSGYLDGLQVFSMMDPSTPTTVAYYDTYTGPTLMEGEFGMYNGAFGVDVRNEDGLIVISDMSTGFWTFRMEGFNGWNGEDWGMPNISSVQHWDEQSKEGTR
ncbi:MAG: hypothetical protein EBR20_05725 [Bacteroidetes bacterium]|jgi:hypothetical protein|nr:hypothetical protein [Bacteroidota bacterium]